MILIVGLGNPGKEFQNTRHNIGFDIIDTIQNHFIFPEFSKKFNGLYTKKKIFNNQVILFKPMNFMNLSGEPTFKIFDFFNLEVSENLIVFHDDLDLIFSKVRIKISGGHGGHNGIRDLIKFFGKDFNRIKIGIKNSLYDENDIAADKFVLGKFTKKELSDLESVKKIILTNFQLVIDKNFNLFKNKI